MLYVTYDNTSHADGAGSQLQRIISIYMISKYYNIGYIHTHIINLAYQGLKCLESNTSDPSQINMYNELFNLESDKVNSIEEEYNIKYITHDIISKYKDSTKNILLKILYGHRLIDSNIDIMKIPINLPWISNKVNYPLNISIHIRRGELLVIDSERMLPNSYYIECMHALKKILDENNIPFIFHIHTEIVSKPIDISPSHHGILNRIDNTVTIMPEDSKIEEFSCFNEIEYHINDCPIKTLVDLTNSDILLASRSSYSYISSMIKKKGIILFHPFWHKIGSDWISVKSGNDILSKTKEITSICKTIRLHLMGGLGNQLFQYAASLAVAKHNRAKIFLDAAVINSHSSLDYRKILLIKGTASSEEIKSIKYKEITHKNAFSRWNPEDYTHINHIKLIGYFQYLNSIIPEVILICNDINTMLADNLKFIADKYSINEPETSYFIHLRRGDYLKKPTLHWIQDESYYLAAIELLRKNTNIKKIFVLSDDINWCKEKEWLNTDSIQIVDEPNEVNGLMVMSLCRGGAIISNSTYSWWGAMLGCGMKSKSVIYPLKWYGDEKVEIFPEGWIGM